MSKRIPITPAIEASIRHGIGDPNADVSNFAVFETRLITNEPLKKSGFYKGAVVTPRTIGEMNQKLMASGSAIPMQLMHDTSVTPQGKLFQAQQGYTDKGAVELRGMFFLPPDRTQLISDVDNSVIDEVSIGIKAQKAMCSECEFDYFSPEADISNLLSLTCANGHTIGVDGVHVNLDGLDMWIETSLVGTGAAKNAKIMPRAQQIMSKESFDRMAASHLPGEAYFLTASSSMSEKTKPKQGDTTMPDNTELVASLTASLTELGTLKAALSAKDGTITALTTERDALKASLVEKDTEIAALKAAAPKSAELLARAEAAEAEVKLAVEKITPHAQAALVASGDKTELPKTLTAMVGLIEEKGLKLHQIVGSKADGTKSTGDQDTSKDELAAKANFKLS